LLVVVSRGAPLEPADINKLEKITRLLLEKKKLELAEQKMIEDNPQEIHQHLHLTSEHPTTEQLLKLIDKGDS
jgi:hypothetical protein